MKRLISFVSQRSKTESQAVAPGYSAASLLPNARLRRRGLLAGFFIAALLGLPLAAGASSLTIASVFNGTGLAQVSLAVFIIYLIRLFLAFLGVLAVAFIMYGGYVWMTASGDSGKVEKAKLIIKNTVIGLIIIMSAYAIASFVMAWLSGATGTGTGGTNYVPGGNGDWGRSGIGAGPIQSVYPKPNQVNVPINTRIAVTFKEDIDPNSLCGESYCDGKEMKNVTICEISSTANSSDCLADSKFNAAAFTASTISQASTSDFKTFIISAATFLGDADSQNRTFKVVLGKGIIAKAANASIFSGFRYDNYTWSFKTNGVLDLDPPQIANLGIYPNPDAEADGYAKNVQAVAGNVQLGLKSNPTANLEAPMYLTGAGAKTAYAGGKLSGFAIALVSGSVAPKFVLNLNSDSGFKTVSDATIEDLLFTVSDDQTQARFTNYAANAADFGITFDTCASGSAVKACLPITNKIKIDTKAGFYFETNGGELPRGSQWKLSVIAPKTGSSFTISNGAAKTNYIFADAGSAAMITKTAVAATGQGTVNTDYYTIAVDTTLAQTLSNLIAAVNKYSGSVVTAKVSSTNANTAEIMPKYAGANDLALALNSGAAAVLSQFGSLSGTNAPDVRTVKPSGSKADPYNNSVFRITFNKPINPIGLDNFIKVNVDGVEVSASTTLSNNYQSVELVGTHPCGTNNCGEQMYCWMEPSADAAVSKPANVEIIASRLKTCVGADDEWCKSFGGTCSAGSRCISGSLYYPQAAATPDGITDLSNNSFNGNFNKEATAKGFMVGNAEGRSGTDSATLKGFSGKARYNANAHTNPVTNAFSYLADSAVGDNFFWSFFISTQVDTAAPLLTKILPVGDYALGSGANDSFRDPVTFVFNTLMRAATARPGWGYGTSTSDSAWNIRYLVLKTLTSGANPVGYWTSLLDVDEIGGQGVGDGSADYSTIYISHNPFDQSVSYAPLAGSGLQSMTQNCYIPGNGPMSAGSDGVNYCHYTGNGNETSGCVTDTSIPETNRVTSTNPASYGYLNCKEIDGAVECNKSAGSDDGYQCKVQNATSTASANGSWVITKDHPSVLTPVESATAGRTGCCFGKCLNK